MAYPLYLEKWVGKYGHYLKYINLYATCTNGHGEVPGQTNITTKNDYE